VDRLGLPSRLRDVGVPEEDLEAIARDLGEQQEEALAILRAS
jgi:alcohol dehydrogenase class IV